MNNTSIAKILYRSLFPSIMKGVNTTVYKAPKITRRTAFSILKNTTDYATLCQTIDALESIPQKHQEYIYGNPLPLEYSTLGQSAFCPIGATFISEINWLLLTIRKHAYKLELFLLYKKIFEENLVLGNYIEAEKYLTKIESEICCSIWSLENRFLLSEYHSSGIENKDFLSKFNEENMSTGYVKSIAHYLSQRVEKTLSVNRYKIGLENSLDRMKGEMKDEHKNFYLFNLSYLNYSKFENEKEILALDFQHSIIDRYLNLRKLLILKIFEDSERQDDQAKVETEYVSSRVNYLYSKIKDPVLAYIRFYQETDFSIFDKNDLDSSVIKILDLYTTGLYSDVEEELNKLLIEKPLEFDLYELYIKALVYQKKDFVCIGNEKNIQNQILKEMYKIISATSNPREAGMNLFRIATNLTSSTISYGITYFVEKYANPSKKDKNKIACLSRNILNPSNCFCKKDLTSRLVILKRIKDVIGFKSITVDYLISKEENPHNMIDYKGTIPKVKYLVEQALFLQQNDKFTEAIDIWKQLIEEESKIAPIYEISVRNLFYCYEKQHMYDHCIKLYVNSFFNNIFIVGKIETANLLTKIRENRFKIVSADLDLPIFYTITGADENEVHIAFEKFNLNAGSFKPSELLIRFGEFDEHKILFYLKYTCNLEILKHSIHINGSKDRLEERLSIDHFLINVDKADKEFYDDEIKYISNILIIQKGLLELDESKIYVNEQGIINNELKEYDAVYQRFNSISGIANKNKMLFLSDGKLITLDYSKDQQSGEKIIYSSNPVFDIYKELFEAIKDKFLHSKFGIVAYLSTRIRHGVLLGELRPIFEKHKLITLKEGNSNKYRDNNYWDRIYEAESDPIKLKIQEILGLFSQNIDDLIFDLIKKHLQVYDEENNKDGWFDYNFSDDDLFWFSIRAIQSKDYNNFIQEVFEILWHRTDENLIKIRDSINCEIASRFNNLFDKLEQDLSEAITDQQQIVLAIKSCSTEIQTVIARISSWFKRSGTSASDFTLDHLIDIVMEYTNKAHPNKRINLSRKIDCVKNIKGEFLTHLADLLRIFTENILKHSDDNASDIKAIIRASEENNILFLQIENEITNKNNLQALKNVWDDDRIDTNKLIDEGKSGYHKAYKIIKSDLQDEENYLSTYISENEDSFSVSLAINLSKLIVS